MGPARHAAVAALSGGAVYAVGGGRGAAVAAFLAGTLIDADHLLDYILSEGFRFRWEAVRSGSYFRKRGKALVLLHSYECVILAAALLVRSKRPGLARGLVVGAATHLISDIRYYHFTPFCYSITYRVLHGFRLEAFKPKRISQGVTNVS